MPKATTKNKPYKLALVLPDIHIPYEDKQTLAAVLRYAADERWDHAVLLGDVMDFNCISAHNNGRPRLVEGESLGDDYDAGNAFLDSLSKAVRRKNPDCKIAFLEGNHEYRVERLLDAEPTLRGTIEVPKMLALRARGIQFVPSWSRGKLYRIGNAYFHHGRYTGIHHAKKHVEHYGVPIYYGHVHDIQGYSKVLHGRDLTIEGASLGCLCDYEQRWMQGAPDKWQQAITVFRIFPDGYFQRETVAIFKHRFVGPTTGRVYEVWPHK
jgi:predicted phosphodiesterase